MPLSATIQKGNNTLALWTITEPVSFFENNVNLSPDELQIYRCFKNESRKREWLAVRCLLQETLKMKPQIEYSETGKPFLKNHPSKLSISHSRKMAGILIKQQIRNWHRRNYPTNDKAASRFLSESERMLIEKSFRIWQNLAGVPKKQYLKQWPLQCRFFNPNNYWENNTRLQYRGPLYWPRST